MLYVCVKDGRDFVYYVCIVTGGAVGARVPFGMVSLSAISMMFVKNMLAVCMLVGMVV